MKIVVIGLGSMGRRRIRMIRSSHDSYEIKGVDLNAERRKNAEAEFGIRTSADLDEVLDSFSADCAMVCAPPLSHSEIIRKCLTRDLHVFTELNLVADGYGENTRLARERNRVLFLSSTFLYRAEIIKIGELVGKQEKKLNYAYHVGQYLPDWHPWERYGDFFVADKRTNGCREIFAIELPWLVETFGNVSDIAVKKDKISSLHVDYDDNYVVLLNHESGHKGMLAVDVVSRKAVRNLEVFGEDMYLSWDGSAEGLKIWNAEYKKDEQIQLYDRVERSDQYSRFIVENAYREETEAFFRTIGEHTEPVYDFRKDRKVLELIDRIEAS